MSKIKKQKEMKGNSNSNGDINNKRKHPIQGWIRTSVFIIILVTFISTLLLSNSDYKLLHLGLITLLFAGAYRYFKLRGSRVKNSEDDDETATTHKFTIPREAAIDYFSTESRKLYSGCGVISTDVGPIEKLKRKRFLNGTLFEEHSEVFITQYKAEQNVILRFNDKLRSLNPSLFEMAINIYAEELLTKSCILTNRIEGLILPETHTLTILKMMIQNQTPPETYLNLTTTQLKSIQNYYNAWKMCLETSRRYSAPITLDDILKIQSALSPESPGLRKEKQGGTIITNTRLLLPRSEEVEPLTNHLITWLNSVLDKGELSPFDIVINFQARFLRIYPFKECNGQLARLLSSLIMLKYRLFPLIMSSMHPVLYKEALYEWHAYGNTKHFGLIMWKEFNTMAELYADE